MNEKPLLPGKLQISQPFGALVYPVPGLAVGDPVQGEGEWTIHFEPLEEGKIRLRFSDLHFQFTPESVIHFDVDGDSRLERIGLADLPVSDDQFNLEQSGGVFDPETGQVQLQLVFEVDPHSLPDLQNMEDLGPLRFALQENGRFDLESGRYMASSDLFTVPDGPFKGLTVLNCMHLIFPFETKYSAKIAFGVALLSGSPVNYVLPAGQLDSEVWKCANTGVRLAWDASLCSHLVIKPLLGKRPIVDEQRFPDPYGALASMQKPIRKTTMFIAESVGGEGLHSKRSVIINVVSPGDEIPQKAVYDDSKGAFLAELPNHTYDENILVDQILIDSTRPDAVSHSDWRVDHTYGSSKAVNALLPRPDTWQKFSLHGRLPGTYRFTPMPSMASLPSADFGRTIFFKLKVARCR